jgi:hypothetical protein
VAVGPGICVTIPAGTRFQFRTLGDAPLAAFGVTMPPWPDEGEKYPISSTRRWATATDVAPGASSKCAALPRPRRASTRTSEPSGATTSGWAGSARVSNRSVMASCAAPLRRPEGRSR